MQTALASFERRRRGAVPDVPRRLEALRTRFVELEREVEALRRALDAFAEEREARLGPLLEASRGSERLVRRLAELEETLNDVLSRRKSRRPRPRRKKPPARDAIGEPAVSREYADPSALLKDLYRSLARQIHPDLARTESDRARLTALLRRVNAAYAEEDRLRLELLAAEVDRELPEGDDTFEERRAVLAERRLSSLSLAVSRLGKELERLRSGTLFDEYQRATARSQEAAFAEAQEELEAKIQRQEDKIREGVSRVAEAARQVNERVRAGRAVHYRGPGPRRAVLRPARLRVNEPARRFAERLERMAEDAPWQLGLALMAFFTEVSDVPPRALGSFASVAERYECLRPKLRGAPRFERALCLLPPGVGLGLRRHADAVRFGLQLADPSCLAGTTLALESDAVSLVARHVLRSVGPLSECRACGAQGFLTHLFRTRSLDCLHGLVCGRCGHVHESYHSFGKAEGLETLNHWARALGVVDEQSLVFGGATVRFQMLPKERQELTGRQLVRRFRELYLDRLLPDAPEADHPVFRLRLGAESLRLADPVPVGATPTLVLFGRPQGTERRLVASLRSRIAARFRK